MGQYCAEQIPVRYAGPGAAADPLRRGLVERASVMPRLDMFARRWARTAPNQLQLPQLLPIRGCMGAAIDRRLRVRFRLFACRWAGAVRLKFQLALLVPARPHIARASGSGPNRLGPRVPVRQHISTNPHMKAMNTASPMTTAA